MFLGHVQAKRPEDLLAILSEAEKGPIRPSRLLQQLGCLMLVGSVGFRGARAALGRHCGVRSWQRYKKELKSLPVVGATGFSALRDVGMALEAFNPLRMANLSKNANQ